MAHDLYPFDLSTTPRQQRQAAPTPAPVEPILPPEEIDRDLRGRADWEVKRLAERQLEIRAWQAMSAEERVTLRAQNELRRREAQAQREAAKKAEQAKVDAHFQRLAEARRADLRKSIAQAAGYTLTGDDLEAAVTDFLRAEAVARVQAQAQSAPTSVVKL